MRRPSRPVHRSQTLIRKIPNEIKVSRFGFRNTLLKGSRLQRLGSRTGVRDGDANGAEKRSEALTLSVAVEHLKRRSERRSGSSTNELFWPGPAHSVLRQPRTRCATNTPAPLPPPAPPPPKR